MTNSTSPCMGCEKREVGCHARCGAYKEYRKALDEYNANIREKKDAEIIARDMTFWAKLRMTRHMGKLKKRGWTK